MKPIETIYRGYKFRSRLEARWAVFFDSLDIDYEYEKEGYDLNGIWYLPDFWLPKLRCWIEIKGEDPTAEEEEKAKRLAMHLKTTVFVFSGQIPDVLRLGFWQSNSAQKFSYDEVCDENLFWDNHYAWCECPVCGLLGLEFEGRAGRLPCNHGRDDKSYNYDSPRLQQAYLLARQHQFEFKDGR